MLRWTIRIVLAFIVLVAAVAVIAHFVLQSAWLHELVLARVSDEIGLIVTAESLKVGWGGNTTIREVTVRMPLEDEVILTADQIALTHEVLPLLILRRSPNVLSVEVDSPKANLRRYEGGRWNVQDVWTRLRASFDETDEKGGRATLPRLVIRDALTRVTEPNGTSHTVGPLHFEARREGQLVWQFELELPQVVGVQGRVAQGSDWTHKIGFAVDRIQPLVRDVLGRDLSPIQIAGRWEGKVLQGELSGILRLDKLAIGQFVLRGGASIEAGPEQITLRPRSLVLSEPNLAGEEIELTAGAVQITQKRLNIERLAAKTSRLTGQLTGHWDLDTRVGEVAGSWVTTYKGPAPSYHGICQASVKSPRYGRKEAQVRVTAQADAALGDWSFDATAHGLGTDWRESTWRVSFPTFLWSRNEREADLTGAAAEVDVQWPEVRLTSLHMPNADQTGAGAEYNVDTQRWSAHLKLDGLRLEALGRENLNLLLAAEGDTREARVSEFHLAQGGKVVMAEGVLSLHERKLQDIRVVADWPTGTVKPEDAQAENPIGRWHLEADVTGRVQPLAVEVDGELTGQNIALGKQTVRQVKIPVQAKADAGQIRATTQPFTLLGGQWQLNGQHKRSAEVTQVSVVADNLSLEAAAGMAGLPLTSRGRARAELQLAVPNFDIHKAVARGSWSAEDINIPPLEAQRARGKLQIAGGLVKFEEIILEQDDGQAEASLEFRLDDPHVLSVELKTDRWPVRFEDRPASLLADGQASLRLNVVKRTANGKANVSGAILWAGQELARVRVSTLVEGQTLDMHELYAETLGGSVEGKAVIPLNRWTTSVAQLRWQGIRPRQLARWAPQFERFEGVVCGALTVEQALKKAHPAEPMRLVLYADVADGRFGPAQVEGCYIVGYVGQMRALINKAVFQVLGGQINARTRVSKHVGKYHASVVADVNSLNLDQIAHVIDPNAGEYAGQVSGQATVLASSDLDVFGGEAKIRLAQSDLAGNSVVGALYSALNLRFGRQQPTGTGEIKIQLAGPSVVIPSFFYFNRGVEIRGAGRLGDIRLGAESPVDGYAVASTRVLKGIELPGVDTLDRLLASFQTGTASARIEGTLDHVQVKIVPLPVVLDPFRRLLWNQLRE